MTGKNSSSGHLWSHLQAPTTTTAYARHRAIIGLMAADLVITGSILTFDDLQPTADALAVSDGRIVAVGDRSDIERWIGPGAQTIGVDGA